MPGGSYSLDVRINKEAFMNGEMVSGYVTLDLATTLAVSVVKMKVGGFEKALIYLPPNTDSYFSLPFYCNENVVWSPRVDEKEMEPGTYNFPFTFELPFHLAPSFNYIDSASIYYAVHCFLEVAQEVPPEELPTKTSDFFVYGTKKAKWVNVLVDSKPATAKASKTSLFSKSKPVEFSVCVRRTDYMIGEKLTVHIQVRNHSTSPITTIQAYLMQTVRIDSEGFQKVLSRVKIASQTESFDIPQYFPNLPTPYVQLFLKIPQICGEENVYPSANGKILKVEHSLVVFLPGVDMQVTLPICLWDEVANYLKENAQQEEGCIDWETEWLPVWVDDETVYQCISCNQNFNIFNRKHHCRSCGFVFCAKCTPHTITMKHLGYNEPVRICSRCYEQSLKINSQPVHYPTNDLSNYTTPTTPTIPTPTPTPTPNNTENRPRRKSTGTKSSMQAYQPIDLDVD